ncbi:MAG: histidine phosphatase family protein [Legionellales bacterium]|nr:histidine phosphatase family protein [Legionellales bacterium]
MLQKNYFKKIVFLSIIIFLSLNGLAYSQQISQELVYIRHGDKIRYSKDKKEKEAFKKSFRFKQNPFDEPLTYKGINETKQTAKELLQKIDISKYNYIYSSPMTRCIHTAQILSNEIFSITGKKLQIRIEYGLTERVIMYGFFLPTFTKDQLTIDYYLGPFKDGKFYESPIDKILYFDNLIKLYPEIDASYKSLISEDIILKTPYEAANMLTSTINRIVDENENILIVGHGAGPYIYTHYYLTQANSELQEKYKIFKATGGADSTNFVSIFHKLKGKDWVNVFSPRRLVESEKLKN